MVNEKLIIYKTMSSYCWKCRKNAESKNSTVVKTKNGRIMILSNVQCELVISQLVISELPNISDLPTANILF